MMSNFLPCAYLPSVLSSFVKYLTKSFAIILNWIICVLITEL